MAGYKTIQDLAQEAGVSVSTIDRILSGRGRVKPKTIEHVLGVAEQVDFYAVEAIRSRLSAGGPERVFGFLLNSDERQLYRELASELTQGVHRLTSVHGTSVIRHLRDTDPEQTAQALLELGEEAHIVAGVCVDHPSVNAAVTALRRKGIPFVSMISDVSSSDRAAFVGSNDWQLGRTAGWFARSLCSEGPAAVLMGSARYICQQAHEAGFRNYLRSQDTRLKLVETGFTGESDRSAETVVVDLIRKEPDLTALFVAAGGIEGVVRGLIAEGRSDIVVIASEMTEASKAHLNREAINVILAHPVGEIAAEALKAMVRLSTAKTEIDSFHQIVPFRILVSENC